MISVITPCLNSVAFIERCVENVAAQGCAEVEHIVMDGGSTDGTVEMLRTLAARHSHLRWVSEKDAGQSAAMNKGVAMAGGALVGFLNADDYY
jgi:glycosyltransferase involved in cell wall biosynthesis